VTVGNTLPRRLAVSRTCFPKGKLALFLLNEDGKTIKAE